MQQHGDYSPLLRDEFDYKRTYVEAADYFRNTFDWLANLGPSDIALCSDLLEYMGLSVVKTTDDATITGFGKILYTRSKRNEVEYTKDICLKWFARLNQYGFDIWRSSFHLKAILTKNGRHNMWWIDSGLNAFMILFEYVGGPRLETEANFEKRQYKWVYKEALRRGRFHRNVAAEEDA